MLKSLPVSDPETLFRLGDADNCCVIGGAQTHFSIFSYPLYIHLRDNTPEIQRMAAFQAGIGRVGVRRSGDSGMAEPFATEFVSGNYFTMFGLRPSAGRLLTVNDDVRGAMPAAVMSYRVWQHYGGDRSIIGSNFVIGGTTFTIAGVAPSEFFGETLRPDPPDFWIPLATEPVVHKQTALIDHPDGHWLYIIGRIPQRTQLAGVESRLNVELKQWLMANEPPGNDAERKRFDQQHITLVSAGGGVPVVRQNYERDLRLLLMVTTVVLLIACANVANLQLARGAANAQQIAVCIALGARRSRVVRQILTECLLLALLGGLAGLMVAMGLTRLLIVLAFHGAAYVPIDTMPDLPVLAAAFLLSVLSGTLFGIAPAWSASSADPAESLRRKGRSASGSTTQLQKSLVLLQAGLSLTLVAAAGLMVQTVRNLQNQQFGFNLNGAIVVSVNSGFSGYPPERLAAIYNSIEERIRNIPGVADITMALYSPMSGDNWQAFATLEDHPDLRISPSWNRVSASFFRTIGARVLRGRSFDEHDTPVSTHVAIVNEAFAEKAFPNEDPIGKRFGLGGPQHATDYQIVGVVNNVLFRYPRHPEVAPMFFIPLLQMAESEWRNGTMARSNLIQNIILHVSGSSSKVAGELHNALSGIDSNLTILSTVSMQDLLSSQVQHERLIAQLAGLLGVLTLVLASIGLYGVTSYAVVRRTAEIGVRSALGATRWTVIRLILIGALFQIALGLAFGTPVALVAGKLLSQELYQVSSADPLTLAAAGLVVLFSGAAAAIVPSFRASAVDPVIALRTE